MVISIPVSKAEFCKTYLSLWNGILKLTDKELEITAKLLEKQLEISTKVTDPKLVNKLLFDSSNLKEIRESLGMKENLFNNYKASLKAKNVIRQKDNNYSLDPRLIPVESITFKFICH